MNVITKSMNSSLPQQRTSFTISVFTKWFVRHCGTRYTLYFGLLRNTTKCRLSAK